eukprot:CAMPEP_0114576820 /NCGR_PEP_ID=MMETSP0125-20121206/1544_1 /TAXON_ID=485358 ORGANISM="Aristerostoma sp., Strain ATCC 50986" /NCGR_SAMPLE_ID=MMETSP0125 /ASSEMBLY_ACC=CAM_ASM_000245 /LENGTH=156 /DNA_ID=CAMNT_0001765641 /DNA_START=678 /DNA_END=1148 /DNA_ORIENTATION=-
MSEATRMMEEFNNQMKIATKMKCKTDCYFYLLLFAQAALMVFLLSLFESAVEQDGIMFLSFFFVVLIVYFNFKMKQKYSESSFIKKYMKRINPDFLKQGMKWHCNPVNANWIELWLIHKYYNVEEEYSDDAGFDLNLANDGGNEENIPVNQDNQDL